MNYNESRVYLDELSRYGSVLGLDSMRELLHRLGDPQDGLKFIHVAGTNGKGSILSYLSSILIQAGYTTGCYFSPWLFEYGEQFQVNGVHIADDELARHTTEIAEAISSMVVDGLNSPTLFEAETALAMLYFKNRGCDFVVLETGLGGREEAPPVEEVGGKEHTDFEGAKADDITFSYEDEIILKNVTVDIEKGKVLGIHGASGSGKSTLLKLIMRFWDVKEGQMLISEKDIKEINTDDLRSMSSCVTQDTILFRDTIANNIRIANPDAELAKVEEAAKKASIHDFIIRLPHGYETNVGELGGTLSDGEKQRVGLARAFLHDSNLLLLDEPTSNLDVLNEGIILKSLENEKTGKTMVLVSHRKSTLSLADRIYEMDNGRLS